MNGYGSGDGFLWTMNHGGESDAVGIVHPVLSPSSTSIHCTWRLVPCGDKISLHRRDRNALISADANIVTFGCFGGDATWPLRNVHPRRPTESWCMSAQEVRSVCAHSTCSAC